MSDCIDLIAFRRQVCRFAEKLSDEELRTIAYVRLEAYKNANVWDILSKLETDGVFSPTKPEGLIEIARDINRIDLASEVEKFIKSQKRKSASNAKKRTHKRPKSPPQAAAESDVDLRLKSTFEFTLSQATVLMQQVDMLQQAIAPGEGDRHRVKEAMKEAHQTAKKLALTAETLAETLHKAQTDLDPDPVSKSGAELFETSRHKLPVPIQSRIVPAKPTPKPLISQKKVPEGLASLRAPVQETGNSAQSITGYMVDTHQVLQANPLADSVYEELEDSTAGTGDSGFEDVELWKRYMQHPPSRPLIPDSSEHRRSYMSLRQMDDSSYMGLNRSQVEGSVSDAPAPRLESSLESQRTEGGPPTAGAVRTYLPGMNVIGQTQIIIQDDQAQSFEWGGYGLKLFIPNHTLSSGVNQCLISIQAGLSGQFTLPQEYSLVAPVYGITVTAQFAKQVTLEIEHCALCNSPDDCEALTFAVAKTRTKELPYSFEVLPGGVFTPKSSHGSIRVHKFSLYTILAKLRSRKRYCAQLFYFPIQLTYWRLCIVFTRDLEAETQKAAEIYSHRMKVHDMKFKFQFGEGQSSIQLNIPSEGAVTPEGWNIIVPHTLEIAKEEMDSFRSSIFHNRCSAPSCELRIRWVKNQKPQPLNHRVSLAGTSIQNAYFAVCLSPGCDDGSRTEGTIDTGPTCGHENSDLLSCTDGSRTEGTNDTGPTCGHENSDLLTIRDHYDITCYLTGVNNDILQSLGIALGIAYHRLQNIRAAGMVDLWLQKVDQVMERGGPTWATLEKCMRHETVGLNGKADDVKKDKL